LSQGISASCNLTWSFLFGLTVQALYVTIGFLKEAPEVGIHGFNLYHKNRLIMVIVAQQRPQYGNID
jgi:hypothetical protein